MRTLSLVVCTFTYLLVGAAVFDALESDMEEKRLQVTEGLYCVVVVFVCCLLTVLFRNVFNEFHFHVLEMRSNLLQRYNISDDDFRLIETVIIESRPHKAGPQWKFSGAFYFAIVVVAVIGSALSAIVVNLFLLLFNKLSCVSSGYGHSTPATVSGKGFCIAYAMIGIPLGIFMFQSIGERLNKFISIVIRKMKVQLFLGTSYAGSDSL